jgi:hypothetical protein
LNNDECHGQPQGLVVGDPKSRVQLPACGLFNSLLGTCPSRVATLRGMDDQRWETAALRESQARHSGRPAVSQERRPVSIEPAMWVTLREASDATGIPVGTLGSWARRGTVESYLEGNGGRKLRIVDLNDVRGRARELGRPVAPVPVRRVAESEAPSTAEQRSAASPPPGGGDENMMIVPLDAWNKMLNQLGNLHEAGQQLAEARERAAKAETEVVFLRERLSELREQDSPAATEQSSVGSPPPSGGDESEPWMPPETEPTDTTPSANGDEPGGSPQRLWRTLYAGWKSRRR